jgi:capsule biosynthesis phosphatase
MIYVFDLDGTLCTHVEDGDYRKAKPIKERIKKVNKLSKEGHNIVLYTARGMGRYQGNAWKCNQEFRDLTERQLKEWDVTYSQLILGKPSGDFYIDDKGIKDGDFFADDSR